MTLNDVVKGHRKNRAPSTSWRNTLLKRWQTVNIMPPNSRTAECCRDYTSKIYRNGLPGRLTTGAGTQ